MAQSVGVPVTANFRSATSRRRNGSAVYRNCSPRYDYIVERRETRVVRSWVDLAKEELAALERDDPSQRRH